MEEQRIVALEVQVQFSPSALFKQKVNKTLNSTSLEDKK